MRRLADGKESERNTAVDGLAEETVHTHTAVAWRPQRRDSQHSHTAVGVLSAAHMDCRTDHSGSKRLSPAERRQHREDPGKVRRQ